MLNEAGLKAAASPDLLVTGHKLSNEVGGLRAFEPEIRGIIGNTNWAILMQRLDEAGAAIAKATGRAALKAEER